MSESAEQTIFEAFRDTPYPGDEHLVVNGSGTDPECNEIAEAFRAKRWTGISATQVRRFAEALPLFTPAAFRYFLPAYMLAVLETPEAVDLANSTVPFNLTPPRDQRGWEFRLFRTYADAFNSVECAAIASFLRVMQGRERDEWISAGRPVPNDALERAVAYWASR